MVVELFILWSRGVPSLILLSCPPPLAVHQALLVFLSGLTGREEAGLYRLLDAAPWAREAVSLHLLGGVSS